MPPLYEQFRASFGRDGPDYSIVERAVGGARETLESDLIANLDYYEALALGVIRSTAAVPPLVQMFNAGSNDQRCACGRALWDIERDPSCLNPILEVISDRDATEDFDRIRAVGLLTDVNHPVAFDALTNALFDPEYLVRYNAAVIFTHNVGARVDDRTIHRNTRELDQAKLERFANRLNAKRNG